MRLGSNLFSAGVIAAGLAISAPQAQAAILDFSGNICGGPCGNYGFIDASYGSGGGATVSYDRDVNSGGETRLSWWDGYSNLQGIAWGGSSTVVGRPSILITPDSAGTGIRLNSFSLGSYLSTNRSTQFTIFAGNTNQVLYSSAALTVGALAFDFTTPITSALGIRIEWGPDGYDVGIDNVNFEVVRVQSAVPEPATWAMMLVGFAGLGFAARRRKAMAL